MAGVLPISPFLVQLSFESIRSKVVQFISMIQINNNSSSQGISWKEKIIGCFELQTSMPVLEKTLKNKRFF
jgi:hypothetical protein